jgi:hypothetical protein
MKLNKLMLGACVFSLGIATAASSYHLKIIDPTWVGQKQLTPGDYQVTVDGDKVTFKQGKSVIAVAAKVETNESKFSDTMMNITNENGQAKLKEIDLKGTKSKIMLSDAAVEAGGTR